MLQSRVEELVSQNKAKDTELSRATRDAHKKQDGLELEVKALKHDLERKERRLELKMRKIEEIQTLREQERQKYEVAYKGTPITATLLQCFCIYYNRFKQFW